MTTALLATQPWFAEYAVKILEGVASISANVSKVAKVYVDGIDRDPSFKEYLVSELPSIQASFWRSLEKVGRNQLDGRILNGAVPFGNKLRLLPISEQKSAIENHIELLVGSGDKLLVKIDAITSDQAEQIFARDHIRSLEEQRAWVESKRAQVKYSAKCDAPPVELDKKRKELIIGNVRITASELADYLRKLME